jgi:hypothetical protein
MNRETTDQAAGHRSALLHRPLHRLLILLRLLLRLRRPSQRRRCTIGADVRVCGCADGIGGHIRFRFGHFRDRAKCGVDVDVDVMDCGYGCGLYYCVFGNNPYLEDH